MRPPTTKKVGKMSETQSTARGQLENCEIDQELHNIQCPRSVWNRAAVIYHMTRAKLEIDLESKLLFAACISYALKECCASTSLPGLLELRKNVSEVEAAVIEALIFEYVRPHTILIESCLRLQLKTLTMHVASLYSVREPVTRIALALAQELYNSFLCLFPESCARACLLAACALYPIEVDSATLPASFQSQLVNCVYASLLPSRNFVQWM